jgi:hypothetical protein
VRAHPKDWVEVLVACVLMQPVIWYWAAWLRRHKLADLGQSPRDSVNFVTINACFLSEAIVAEHFLRILLRKSCTFS